MTVGIDHAKACPQIPSNGSEREHSQSELAVAAIDVLARLADFKQEAFAVQSNQRIGLPFMNDGGLARAALVRIEEHIAKLRELLGRHLPHEIEITTGLV